MIEQNALLVLTCLPFVAAALAVTLPRQARNAEAWLSGLVMAAGVGILAPMSSGCRASG